MRITSEAAKPIEIREALPAPDDCARPFEKTIDELSDWFVRNSDISIGVFLTLAELPPTDAL